MKLSIISLLLSAGIAISQVGATPLRVVVVSGQVNSPSIAPIGQEPANPHPLPAQPRVIVSTHAVNIVRVKVKVGCMGLLRAKLSKWFSHLFALPVPSNTTVSHPSGSSEEKPSAAISAHGAANGRPSLYYPSGQPIARPLSFTQRLTLALMTLDPWEGRIISFILGCGLGVILRMFWVLTVIAIRSVRGKKREEEFLRDEVIFEEEPLLPPQYAEVKGNCEIVPERSG